MLDEETREFQLALRKVPPVKALIVLVLTSVFASVFAFGGMFQACAGVKSVHVPARDVVIWVHPAAERTVPGLTASFELNADRFCVNRGICRASVRETDSPEAGDWMVIAGGQAPGKRTLARTLPLIIQFYTSQSDGDRIRFVPPGECRTVLPPRQRDAELDVVVGHELGHALGLVHALKGADDIMRPNAACDDIRP